MIRATGFTETALPPASPWRDEVRATMRLSAPLVLINLAQHGLVASNAVLLGRLGAEPVAAGALATSLYLLLFIGGIGLTSAVAPLVAEAAGGGRAGDEGEGEVRRTVRAGLWLGGLLGAVLMPLLWHTEALLAPLGLDPAVLREAGAYMRVLQWWMLPALAFMVLKGALAALQRPGPPLTVSLAALPLNIALGAFFAFGPPTLGIVGVALGTVITEFLALAALVIVIGRDRTLRRHRMFARLWQFDGEKLGRIVRVGAPMGVAGVAEAGLFEAATVAMGTFGTVPLAAHAVTLQIAATCFMVPNGIGQAATVRVGRALGAGDAAGLRRAGAVAIGLGLAFMLACAALQLAVPRTLIGLFLDADAPGAAAVMPVAVGFLAFSALFAVSDGVQSVALGALRGLQDTTVPMVIALTGYWGIGVPLGAALAWGAGWGGQGIWAGFCAGLLAVSILLVARWLRLSAHHRV
ncbi:MATE family multidrug resistance protein [Methylorubrum rhodinum]|uniref:Multidrug-efflux transporter n=1 Tax=Methylorubrum rhodinum TaxID=29428 RepID=A0A840ZT38_9HYPH|nr:MATE family efflux transporter [Methylorubrum rhodinum]MBB5760205.1 MATE family multidrug resistance protein [Methylorubrum rhodinum]